MREILFYNGAYAIREGTYERRGKDLAKVLDTDPRAREDFVRGCFWEGIHCGDGTMVVRVAFGYCRPETVRWICRKILLSVEAGLEPPSDLAVAIGSCGRENVGCREIVIALMTDPTLPVAGRMGLWMGMWPNVLPWTVMAMMDGFEGYMRDLRTTGLALLREDLPAPFHAEVTASLGHEFEYVPSMTTEIPREIVCRLAYWHRQFVVGARPQYSDVNGAQRSILVGALARYVAQAPGEMRDGLVSAIFETGGADLASLIETEASKFHYHRVQASSH